MIRYGYCIKNDTVEFFVHDTGIGIHEDNISKIFNMFVQIVNRSDKKQEGTGLGLTICKAIVELLGGKIWLESTFQKESTFYFTLPYEKINSKIDIVRKTPDKIKKYNWVDKKLLLIEDNDNNSKLAEIILEPTKIQMILAKNRMDFYDLYTNDIDIILMDVQLPDCNGYDLIRQIREHNENIPIITITAFTSKENETLSYEMGANFFMTKPVKWFDLLMKIDELL